MSEVIKDDSVGHEADPHKNTAYLGSVAAQSEGILPPEATERQASRTLIAGRFDTFSRDREIDLSNLHPAQRPEVAGAIVDFVFSVVDNEDDELHSRLPGLAHTQKRVIERHLREYYADYPPTKDDESLKVRRYEYLRHYGRLATEIESLRRYRDLSLISTLKTTQEDQARIAAHEVLAAYGMHYSKFMGRMHPESQELSRIPIGALHPVPQQRRVVKDFGHIQDEE